MVPQNNLLSKIHNRASKISCKDIIKNIDITTVSKYSLITKASEISAKLKQTQIVFTNRSFFIS